MKFIKWLWDTHFYLIMTVIAAVGFIVGMVYAYCVCCDMDKPQTAVTASATTTQAPTLALAEKPDEQEITYWDSVPLHAELQEHIAVTSRRYGIEPEIVFAICYRESSYNTEAVGDNCNSYGLMQIQPKWHSKRMQKLGVTDLLDPYQNVLVGIDYLAELIGRYNGNIGQALTAYNQGQYRGTITHYAINVMETAGELNGVYG